MKRVLFLLCALLMLAALPILAEEALEEVTCEVTYEGVEVQFWMSDWMMWVPAEWPVEAADGMSQISVGDKFSMYIECSLSDRSVDEVYASLSRGANFKEDFITYKTINGFRVMIYRDEWYFFDLGDGTIADCRINLVKPFLKDYEGTREMVMQMISSLHLPAEE